MICEICKKESEDTKEIIIEKKSHSLCKTCYDKGEGFFVCDQCEKYHFDESMECFGAKNICSDCRERYLNRLMDKYADLETIAKQILKDINETRK